MAMLMIGLSAGLLGGCGERSQRVETFPAAGIVAMGGQPVDGATVEFTPVASATGVAGAQARTDASGRFEMSIMLDNGRTTQPGLPAGEYRVTITKYEAPAGEASLARPPRNILPAKYQSPDSTPFSATVKPESENHFTFSL
ncbi:MAG: hypothetical protein DCC67_15475 [Planctomycetota bacterium]|nr:MAG: hypothetical protein DCC67_15475 [Planctomycetota bacterium]